MKSLLDKLARLKPLRKTFNTVSVRNNQSDASSKIRIKIHTMLATAGLLIGPFVLYTPWPLLVWWLGANNGHPFAPETGTWIFINVGVAFGLCCLWLLPIPLKVRLWITIPYVLIFEWLLMWYCAFANMMCFGF